MIEFPNLWHDRLRHANLNTLRKLINLDLLPKISFDQHKMCEICNEEKKTIKDFFIPYKDR